jgi:plasmid stabilization system protein ParE
MRVVFDPLAKRELDEARDYYNQRQPGLGTEFQEAVKDSVRRLREWPESGAVELQDVRRAVLAVSHQYLQPGYWLARYGSPH